jgi:MFS transporter, ACS family, hexuronate transporter
MPDLRPSAESVAPRPVEGAAASAAHEPGAAEAVRRIAGLRWWVIALVFLATLVNYIDRLTVSVLAPVITADLKLTNLEYASLGTWFLLAYTVSQGLSGRLYDRVGTRRGFALSITVWSLAAMAHAAARGLAGLSVCRFLLGLGEAGNWPGAAKVAAEWFPARERALAMGVFNSGAAIGSIIAPPLIVWLQLRYGWQATFLITGALGFAWLALWLTFYRRPEEHPRLGADELAYIRAGRQDGTGGSAPSTESSSSTESGSSAEPAGPRWRELLGHRQVWAIMLARFLVDPVWWLYLTWLPLFLSRVHGFDLKQIGLFAWVPYVAADAGSLLGGWLSGQLIKRGWTVNRARKAVIAVAALLMPAGIFAARAENPLVALALIAVVLFGFQVWINNVQTLPSDFFAARSVASVAGLGGVGAGLGSMLFVLATGWVVDHFSYAPVLVAAGLLAPLGTALLFTLAGNISPLNAAASADGSKS